MTRDRIIRSAGKRGKTKAALAEALGLSLSHVAKTVNELASSGDLTEIRRTSTGASVFAKPASGAATLSSSADSCARSLSSR